MSKISSCHNVFKHGLLQRLKISSTCGKGLRACEIVAVKSEPNLEALDVHYKEYLAKKISVFKEDNIFDKKDQCLMELNNKLENKWQRIATHNKSILFQNGIDELEKLHEKISKDVNRGIFTHKECYTAYKDAMRGGDEYFKTLPEILGMQVKSMDGTSNIKMLKYMHSSSFDVTV